MKYALTSLGAFLAVLGALLVVAIGYAAYDIPRFKTVHAQCIADGGELANASGNIVCIDETAILWRDAP